MLTQVDADKILATSKFVIDKGKPCNTFHLDLVKNKKYRNYLTPADSIDCPKEYLLDIKISDKFRTKITLHTQENKS